MARSHRRSSSSFKADLDPILEESPSPRAERQAPPPGSHNASSMINSKPDQPRVFLEKDLEGTIQWRQERMFEQCREHKRFFCSDRDIKQSLERIRESAESFLNRPENQSAHRYWRMVYPDQSLDGTPSASDGSLAIIKSFFASDVEHNWTTGIRFEMKPVDDRDHLYGPHDPISRKLVRVVIPPTEDLELHRLVTYRSAGRKLHIQTWEERWIRHDRTCSKFKMYWRVPFRGKSVGAEDHEIDGLHYCSEEAVKNALRWSRGGVVIEWLSQSPAS